MNSILLQKYQPAWKNKFNLESTEIIKKLGNLIIDIQHIGSTSVPGMMAKPIIDIGVLVNSTDDIFTFVNKLKSIGYSYKPEISSNERIFFRKGDPVQYHLSITSPIHTFWSRQILFRDYLISHHEFIQEYNNLKLKNIKMTPEEDFADLSLSETYNKGKGEFVAKILELAK
jgi:GrpB-like predicted nucleotidyltransferase (UPF0157 family)